MIIFCFLFSLENPSLHGGVGKHSEWILGILAWCFFPLHAIKNPRVPRWPHRAFLSGISPWTCTCAHSWHLPTREALTDPLLTNLLQTLINTSATCSYFPAFLLFCLFIFSPLLLVRFLSPSAPVNSLDLRFVAVDTESHQGARNLFRLRVRRLILRRKPERRSAHSVNAAKQRLTHWSRTQTTYVWGLKNKGLWG